MSSVGVGVASKLAGSTPYINTSLETATLYKYGVYLFNNKTIK